MPIKSEVIVTIVESKPTKHYWFQSILQQINIFLLASVNLVKDVSTDWIDYPCL
jgi:hypothetical protein